MPDEPTNWEIVRRLAELENDQKEYERRLSDAKELGDSKYLRKDVWIEARKADAAVVADQADDIRAIKDDRKADAAFRRQVQLALIIAAIGLMGSFALAIFTLLTR